MTASALLADLSARGLTARADGDRVLVCPGALVTPDLAAQIRRHKPELLALLCASCGTDAADACIAAFARAGGVGFVDLVTLGGRTVAYPAGRWDVFAAKVREWNEANARRVT